jgi:hypothetical protein
MAICSILGQADLTALTNNLVATASDPNGDSMEIRLCNRTSQAIKVSVALVPSGTSAPAAQHWITYNFSIDSNCDRVMNPVTGPNNAQIFANPSAAGVSCTVIGVAL